MTIYWCPTCGMVWTASEPPICKHNAVDGPRATLMEPLPPGHPFAAVPSSAGRNEQT